MKKVTLFMALALAAILATPLSAETGEEVASGFDWDTALEYALYVSGSIGTLLAGWAASKVIKFIRNLTPSNLKNIGYGIISRFADGDEEDKARLKRIVDIAGDSKIAKILIDQAQDQTESRIDYITDKIEDYRLKLDTLGEDLPKEHRNYIQGRIATLSKELSKLEGRKKAIGNEDTA